MELCCGNSQFDTFDIAHLVCEAATFGIPVAALQVGLRMHMAPRRLMVLGCVARRSTLQGRSCRVVCFLSRLPRSFVGAPLGAVADASPSVELSLYVDDAGHFADGEERKVAKAL